MVRTRFDWYNPFTCSARSLSAFRILFAAYLIADLAEYVTIVPDFLLENGLAPITAVQALRRILYPNEWSLLFLSDAPVFIYGHIILYAIALVALLLGYKTKLTNVVAFVCLTSLVNRVPFVTGGMDDLARLFLLWSLFVPLNRHWSLDAHFDIEIKQQAGELISPWLSMGLKTQVCVLYLFSGVQKLYGDAWRTGHGVENALNDTMFGSPAGAALMQLMPDWSTVALTYAVLFLQIMFTPLVYSPLCNRLTRWCALTAAAAMHVSFLFLMHVGLFPYLCLTYLVLFIRDDEWDAFVRRLGTARNAATMLFAKPLPPSPHVKLLAASLVALTIACNVTSLPTFAKSRADNIVTIMASLAHVYQAWPLFAPNPQSATHVFTVTSLTRTLQPLDLNPLWEAGWLTHDGAFITTTSHRRLKYLVRLKQPRYQPFKQFATNRLCRAANGTDRSRSRITTVLWSTCTSPFSPALDAYVPSPPSAPTATAPPCLARDDVALLCPSS